MAECISRGAGRLPGVAAPNRSKINAENAEGAEKARR